MSDPRKRSAPSARNAVLDRRPPTDLLPDLDALLARADTKEGRAAVSAEIAGSGTPLYATDPEHPERIVEVFANGTRRVGKLVNRQFIPSTSSS